MIATAGPSVTTLTGYVSALPTPFKGDEIDERAFALFCEWQIAQGILGLVVNGTTGEAPTLSDREQRRLIELAMDVADGRVPVIAGAASNATKHAIKLARQAQRAGADGLLAVTPYYNKPSQEGLYRHFRAVHDATDLPILLYDVPSRTGCTLRTDTIERLAALPRIAGLKDATANLERPVTLRRLLGDRFRLFSGDDGTAFDFLSLGGDGCISVVSNVLPNLCTRFNAAREEGNHVGAWTVAQSLVPLTKALFLEGNPVPVKYALSLMRKMSADVRLPLCPASEATCEAVAEALKDFGIVGPIAGEPAPSLSRAARSGAV
jgi:4-hydroxy-tetrahydrodipicolinate synthase